MQDKSSQTGVPTRRIGMALVGAALGLALAVTAVLAQDGADFALSYKSGPTFAYTGDTITYTIVVVNSGTPTTGVTLSDTIGTGSTYLPASCSYITQTGSPQTCGALDNLWLHDFDAGDRITTTFAVSVTAQTLQWDLTNCAYLSWTGGAMDLCTTTMVNPYQFYLPLTLRGYSNTPRYYGGQIQRLY